MKLIIDIPDDDYRYIKELQSLIIGGRRNCKTIQMNVINAIKNGTPLPKHGRLIDADKLKEYQVIMQYEGKPVRVVSVIAIDNAPTVIEGEKKDV